MPLPAGPNSTPSPAASSVLTGKYSSSYDHLSPAQREALVEELRDAELKYGDRIKQAETIADPEMRLNRLEALKNSFSTKQSMIRKKYGVRLRERRSRAQMEQERSRLGIHTASMMSSSAIQKAMAEIRDNAGTGSPIPATTPEAPRRASGWIAANTPTSQPDDGHADKRQRTASGPVTTASNAAPEESPRRKGLTVSEMGGLGNSAATAATHDPTAVPNNEPPPASQGRTMASMRASGVRTSSGGHRPEPVVEGPSQQGVNSKAIKIETDEEEGEESSDDDDIPADASMESQQKTPSKALNG